MKLVMKGCSISGNQNVGLFIDGDADVSLEDTVIDGNHGPGIIARASVIPSDMLDAIRQAFVQGQTPVEVEATFGERLKSLGRPLQSMIQNGANVAQILSYLQT